MRCPWNDSWGGGAMLTQALRGQASLEPAPGSETSARGGGTAGNEDPVWGSTWALTQHHWNLRPHTLFHFAAPANLKIVQFGSTPFGQTWTFRREENLQKVQKKVHESGLLSRSALTPPHLVILRQDVVHVCHILAGDLLDDQRAVVGVQQEAFPLVIGTPGWGTAGHWDLMRDRWDSLHHHHHRRWGKAFTTATHTW